ncbi:MAG TPA: right-handed parallel beta-helix repeat-containing protein [Acidimicrobiales bacterium]
MRITAGKLALALVLLPMTLVAVGTGEAAAVNLPPGVVVVSPPATIASDCSVDVAKPLYDWLNTLPEGTSSAPIEVLFASGGCYQVDGMLFLRGFTDFDFNGNGSTFRQASITPSDIKNDSPPNRPAYCGDSTDFLTAGGTRPAHTDVMWFIEGGCDIVLENMDIEGKNTSGIGSTIHLADDAGIQLSGAQRVLITNDTIHGVYGDFVTVTGLHEAPFGGVRFPSLDTTVQQCSMKASGRQGVTVVYGQRVAVTANTIAGNIPDSAMDFESDVLGGTEADINVSDNTISGYKYLLSARTGAALFDINVSNNNVGGIRMRMDPFTSANGHDVTFDQNTASAPSAWGKSSSIIVGNMATVLFQGNSVPMQVPTKTFVLIGRRHASTDVAVQDNILTPDTNFLPVPLFARQNVKVTECNNHEANGTPLDNNAHPPNRIQCVSGMPVQPAPAALPNFIS